MELVEAVAEAVQWRIRPILMSATTSMAGILPLALFPGSGSELYRGVGSVVLGGLALSTMLSIFVVPALFTLVWKVRQSLPRLSQQTQS
jgi:HAE1 family hydrophobic/amphiphilic exporter-1